MRKVRLEIRKGCPKYRFWIFSSSLELWQWIQSCHGKHTESARPDGAQEITVRQGGFLEVEFYGFEILRNPKVSGGWSYLNLVRIGELQPSANSAGNVISAHLGWVVDSILSLDDFEDEIIRVKRIDHEDDWTLDLDALFNERH